ncbi:hypothetical protein GL50803_0013720 [Giardia duodenalis]|uniref:Uncharacterized protein n=1 Tax=Giardia intestinalis (strain ATCC 50803 / WB clone C6) TaxID=184922 RepID=A8BK16_GIAIC|nr:hypothetical protein GL50803_0013720 [Giardia intestinalis]KAE8301550.1 hypothetical protein GL50803_0013720 [Giardia intestinalis]|eukprot:XP_001706447.1 Hypothetical protein GL50803_13720 [Giardia lamblia ATCC 50803]
MSSFLSADTHSTLAPYLSAEVTHKDFRSGIYGDSASTQKGQHLLKHQNQYIDGLLIDKEADLASHVQRIFDLNDPIRRLYLLYLSQQADITEVEVCLLKEIMCLRAIVVGYLEYTDTWHEHLQVLPLSASFRTLSASLASRLSEELTERLDRLTNTCAVQTVAQSMTSVHTQTLNQGLSRALAASGLADESDALITSAVSSSGVRLPTQTHNPLVSKVKQLHDLLAEKEARIAELSTDLAEARQQIANHRDSLHITDLYTEKQSGFSGPFPASQDSKLVVKQRSTSAGVYTAKSACEPLVAPSQRASSIPDHQNAHSNTQTIVSAELVPKTVLVNLHKSISERDTLLAEKCEIITTQQKEISWLKEMLRMHEAEKERVALQSTTCHQPASLVQSNTIESDHPLDKRNSRVSFSMDASTPSKRARSKKSRTVEAMIDALELESQVMSLKNQISKLPASEDLVEDAVTRLAFLEQELTQKSISLTDLKASAGSPLSQAVSPQVFDDDISRLIADHQAVFATVERSLSQATK